MAVYVERGGTEDAISGARDRTAVSTAETWQWRPGKVVLGGIRGNCPLYWPVMS